MIRKEDKIKIEDRILSLMEQKNLAPWRCPWMFTDVNFGFGNKMPYRGVNAVITSLYRASMGFDSTMWFTDTKINNLNGLFYDKDKKKFVKDKQGKYDTFYHKRKGCRSIPIIKTLFLDKLDKNGKPILDEDGEKVTYPTAKLFNVYNGDDIVGYDSSLCEEQQNKECTIIDDLESINSAELFQNDILARYKNHPSVSNDGGDRAYYIPSIDEVHVPRIKDFISWQEYASTLAHELSHSTGHKSRLDRNLEGNFGTSSYSKEELVAEFSAAMVLSKYGVKDIPIENSASYIKNWSDHIRANKGILYEAIQQAQKASDMILGIKINEENK